METVDSPKGGQSVSCTKQVTVTVDPHVGLAAVSWSQRVAGWERAMPVRSLCPSGHFVPSS